MLGLKRQSKAAIGFLCACKILHMLKPLVSSFRWALNSWLAGMKPACLLLALLDGSERPVQWNQSSFHLTEDIRLSHTVSAFSAHLLQTGHNLGIALACYSLSIKAAVNFVSHLDGRTLLSS